VPFAIVNRPVGEMPVEAAVPVWRTCLRQVTFADDVEDLAEIDQSQPLVEGDAYRTLLEILCGLQSPMLGETQVLGQFKTFLASLGGDQAWLNRLGQRLLTDAREIRTRHLQGLGSRSYGSAVRRYLAGCEHAVLIGTGKLAQEVLPFMSDDGRTVEQWGRGPEGRASSADSGQVTYCLLDEVGARPVSTRPAALIVAAPVTSDVVDRVAAQYTGLQCVVDLRGELDSAPLHVAAPVVTLQDLFARMMAANGSALHQVDAARAEILSRSRRFELRDELRPFGWHDLCA
jgi:glutamyl-tRNA reductase